MLDFLPKRIRDKIVFAPCPVPRLKGDCWLWTASKHWRGYGWIGIDGRNRYSHIVVFLLAGGSIPEGKQLDHLCRVTSCCNPNHLEAVTGRMNTLRGVGPSAQNSRKTHCIKGHNLEGCRIRKNKRGGESRICRICHREERARHYAENVEQMRAYDRAWKLKKKQMASSPNLHR